MKIKALHTFFILIIGLVWLLNGLYAKVLNQVPRHGEIVGEILVKDHARNLTMAIGFLEVIMAIWVFSQFKSKINAILQITVISTMNILEFFWVPDLLLWGRFNAVFAVLFISLIYFNQFVLKKKVFQTRTQ